MAAKGNTGFKNGLATLVMVIIILGAIVAWTRVANINSVVDAWNYARAVSDHIAYDCMQGKVQWKCRDGETSDSPNTPPDNAVPVKTYDPRHPDYEGANNNDNSGSGAGTGDGNSGGSGTGGTAVDGDTPPNATEGNLPDKKELRDMLDTIAVAEPVEVDYVRDDWKHWSKLGTECNTRIEVLKRDGKDVVVDEDCKIVSGSWVSFYDNETFEDSRGLDIDHVIPLGYAAKHGGNDWDATKKEQFANDMDQLLAVSAKSNRSKSDKGPSEYMPDREFYCEYSKIWVTTADKYGISITEDDKGSLINGLSKCE